MSDVVSDPEERGRLQEALAARRRKVQTLRDAGIDPFALGFEGPVTPVADIRGEFADLEPSAETGRSVRVAGRVVLLRRQGRLSLATLRDMSGDLQLFFVPDAMGDGYAMLDHVDLGDIVGADGEVVTTRRGELSVKVERLTLLTKALRPMPEKWHGLKDPDL